MNLVKAIAIFIAGILTFGVIDRFMVIAPFNQAAVDVVFIGVEEGTGTDGLLNQRFDGDLLDIGQHLNDNLPTSLQHPEDRRFLFSQSASSPFPFEPASAASPALTNNCFGMAFVTGNQVDLVTLDLTFKEDGLFFSTTPLRNCVVICCTSARFSPSSCAIC